MSKIKVAYFFIGHNVLFVFFVGVVLLISRVAPNFGFGKSEIQPFFPNSAKFGFGQISGRIWLTPMQLHCIQLVT